MRTPARAVTVEIERIKGSRFVAHLAPVGSAEEAARHLDHVRALAADASHHCWAWRLQDGRERCDDDGEPRDTAGAPILRHLAGAELVQVSCVVVRWFGGTKLGRGGLVRAYGDAAHAAIERARFIEHVPTSSFRLVHEYDDTGLVDGVLNRHDVTVVEADYGARVQRRIEVPSAAASAFTEELTEATAGRVLVEVDGPAA